MLLEHSKMQLTYFKLRNYLEYHRQVQRPPLVDNSTSLPGYLVRQFTTSFVNMTGNSMAGKVIYCNATRSVIPIISVLMPPYGPTRESVSYSAGEPK